MNRIPLTCSVLVLACLAIGPGGPAYSQDEPMPAAGPGDVAESTPAPVQSPDGPVRMVRVVLAEGDVTWRADSSMDWSAAAVNLPIREGAQVYARTGSHAELQFDDGSVLRLGDDAVVKFAVLTGDADGEFTELLLSEGVASLSLKTPFSRYQVDTPHASIKAVGPARLRISTGDGTDVAVRAGAATVENGQGKSALAAGQYLERAARPGVLADIRAVRRRGQQTAGRDLQQALRPGRHTDADAAAVERNGP